MIRRLIHTDSGIAAIEFAMLAPLLILFMGGGLAVLLGLAALGWITLPIAIAFYIFEVGLVATLQAFIFATLASIYFGGATAAHH